MKNGESADLRHGRQARWSFRLKCDNYLAKKFNDKQDHRRFGKHGKGRTSA